ncbi:MAG TPA: hypothetical protein VH416_04120 [Gaiellaceae bacterium]|jgi:TRAP-type C4-dicarboxylate transport system substrate-binding protein
MAKMKLARPGALGIALTAYDIWRRLPPKQRKQLLQLAREQGPRVAATAATAARNLRNKRPPRPPHS